MKHPVLFIHAATRDHTFLLLVNKKKVIGRSAPKFTPGRSADLLKHLEKLLKKYSVSPRHLGGLVVLSGPGQFSFLRSGIVIANICAWAFRIPLASVYGDEFSTEQEFVDRGCAKLARAQYTGAPVTPRYGKEPNITKSKKKHPWS
jgi:tRNA A37 threonylcarbamoyladenosine modification protein TsaB